MKYTTLKGNTDIVSGKKIFIYDIQDFVKAIDHTTSIVYLCQKDNNSETYFFFPHNGFLIVTDAKGFESIQDAIDCYELGIGGAQQFKQFKNSGADSKEEYFSLLDEGFKTIDEKIQYREKEVSRFFDEIDNLKSNSNLSEKIRSEINNIKSPGDALRFYLKMNEPDIDDLITFLKSSFSGFKVWQVARKKGFDDEIGFKNATKVGFDNQESFSEARRIGIDKAITYKKYCDDTAISESEDYKCLEIFLLSQIPDIPNRFKSIYSRIVQISKKRYGDNYIFTEEFKKINNYTELGILIDSEPLSKRIWPSVLDGLINKRVEDCLEKVVVDASNVCWIDNNNSGANEKLDAQNLVDIEKLLVQYGANEIHFVADANLKFEVKETTILDNMEKTGKLSYSVGGQADRKLLSFAQNRGFILISNDQFRDWTEIDMQRIRRNGFTKDMNHGFDLL